MDLTIIADLLSSINPIVLGGIAGGTALCGGAALYIKKNKNKFIENTDPMTPSNDFKTLKTEDLEREFGSLTVQTKLLDEDEDESLFFNNGQEDNLKEDTHFTHASSKLVDEASVFDCFNKYEQAIESLKKAVEVETHDKEKVRLKILLSQYNSNKGKVSLDNLIKEYPSFHAQTSFNSDNTISALISKPVPKKDIEPTPLPKSNEDFDIFSDLPVISEVPVNNNTPKISTVSNDLTNQVSESSIFNDLPPLGTHLLKDIVVAPESKSEPVQENQFDQFSWNSNTSQPVVEKSTEEMLKELQKDADIIDKVNENEAIDDMSKFWKEFGSMVSDIQAEVSEKNNINNSIPELKEPSIPEFKEPLLPVVQEQKQELPKLTEELSVPKENNIHTSQLPEVKTPIVDVPVLNEVVEDTPIKSTPVVTKEEVKPAKPYKIWANWIVNIQGQQVFRNHFINLTNPWGTSLAAEELYMGINKLSGKTPDNKTYPWVLVSVFPLAK